jgi:hypothetical protein
MRPTESLAALFDRPSLVVSGRFVKFRRSPLQTWARTAAMWSITLLAAASMWASDFRRLGLLEWLVFLCLALPAVWMLYVSARGDVLVVFESAGFRASGRFIPYPAIRSIVRLEGGGVLVKVDQGVDPAGDLQLAPRLADKGTLYEALSLVVGDMAADGM